MKWLLPATAFLSTTLVIVHPVGPDRWLMLTELPRWALLSAALPLTALSLTRACRHGGGLRWSWPLACWLLFICYGLLSLGWSPAWRAGLGEWWRLCLVVVAFCIGAMRPSNARLTLAAFAYGVSINGWIAGLDLFGLPSFDVNHPAGTYFNANALARAAVIALPIALMRPMMLPALPGLVLAIWLSDSMNAMVAIAVLILMWSWRTAAFMTAAVVALAAAVGWFVFDPASWGSWLVETQVARLHLYTTTLENLSPWGHGLGSFWTLFPTWSPIVPGVMDYLTQPQNPHSDLLWLMSALGGVFLLPIIAVILSLRRAPNDAAFYVVVGFLALGLFAFPLVSPVAWVAGFCLGLCSTGGLSVRGDVGAGWGASAGGIADR